MVFDLLRYEIANIIERNNISDHDKTYLTLLLEIGLGDKTVQDCKARIEDIIKNNPETNTFRLKDILCYLLVAEKNQTIEQKIESLVKQKELPNISRDCLMLLYENGFTENNYYRTHSIYESIHRENEGPSKYYDDSKPIRGAIVEPGITINVYWYRNNPKEHYSGGWLIDDYRINLETVQKAIDKFLNKSW